MEDKIQKALETLGVVTVKESVKNDITEVVVDGHTISVMSDKFDKGVLFSNINDVIADFLVEKSGKEIKEKISVIRQFDEALCQSYKDKAAECLKQCSISPTDDTRISDYELRGTKMKFGAIPKMFTWEEVDACDNEISAQAKNNVGVTLYGEKAVEKTARPENHCRMYNQNIRMYVEARVESLILETVMNNMDDSKKYKLTAEQASKLGF